MKKEKVGRAGKLWSAAETAPGFVKRFPEVFDFRLQRGRIERPGLPGGMGSVLPEDPGRVLALSDHPRSLLIPEPVEFFEDPRETASPAPIVRRAAKSVDEPRGRRHSLSLVGRISGTPGGDEPSPVASSPGRRSRDFNGSRLFSWG